MKLKIRHVSLELPFKEREIILDPYFNEVSKMLNENIPSAFDIPVFLDRNQALMTFERDFNILCSPRFILANICHDLYENDFYIRIDKFGLFSIPEEGRSSGMFKIDMRCSRNDEGGVKDIGIFND